MKLYDCILGLSGVVSDDKRVSPSIDVLNELLSNESFLNALLLDNDLLKETVDKIIIVYRCGETPHMPTYR